MSLLFRRGGDPETRALSFQSVWGSGGSSSLFSPGQTALSLVPVYAATGLIADQFAATPAYAYRKDKSGIRTLLDRQPTLLTDPGLDLDLYSWKHQAIASCLLRGNAYGYITSFEANSLPQRVIWLKPDEMFVDEAGVRPEYYYQGRHIPRERMIHIPAYVQPGSVVGLSPLGLFKAQIETGDQAQTFGKNWFKRGGIPSGVLKNNARTLTPEQATETKQRFKSSVSAQEPFVTGNDWDYTAITIPGGESQFIATLKMTATQFAAIYRVAPEDIGGETGGTSLTYKSLEQDQIRFAMRTMRPWTTRFEAVLDQYMPPKVFVRFDLDSSARADMMTRLQAKQIALDTGLETLTEARASENRRPLTPTEYDDFLAYKAAKNSGTPVVDTTGDTTNNTAPIVDKTTKTPAKGGK